MEHTKKGKVQCVLTKDPREEFEDNTKIVLIRPGYDLKEFQYDQVLDMNSNQDQSYALLAEPVVNDVLNGFNGVIMAYGQTGSGKTHTIFGSNQQYGIVPRAVNQIFDFIQQHNDNDEVRKFRVTVSFLEIYMEQISDLLV